MSYSSCDGEYRAIESLICELRSLSFICLDFQIQLHLPITITMWCDNQSTLHITSNLVFHERIKHLKIDCHLVRAILYHQST